MSHFKDLEDLAALVKEAAGTPEAITVDTDQINESVTQGCRVYGMSDKNGVKVDQKKQGTVLSSGMGMHRVRWDNGSESHHREGDDHLNGVVAQRKNVNKSTVSEQFELSGFMARGSQVDELFGLRLGPKQSQLYPQNEFTKYGEDHNRGPLGLPDLGHGYNFNRHMPKIEEHPQFRKAVDVCDKDNEQYSLGQQMEHPAVQAIARDLGHSTFQVHDYVSKGPYYRRFGSLDFNKYSPTDGPLSAYYDKHPNDPRRRPIPN